MAERKRKSLEETYPELIFKGWDYSANAKHPTECYSSLEEKFWWRCGVGHSYRRNIYKEKSNGCPVCSGHKVDPYSWSFWSRCREIGRSDLIEQWDREKNEPQPFELSPHSSRKVWWICSLGHSWLATVASRWTRSCPGCSRSRLEVGFNDLETFLSKSSDHSHLLQEWDQDANGELSTYTQSSGKSVRWKCAQGHSWSAIISNRIAGNRCKSCGDSQFEQELRDFLESLTGLRSFRDRSLLNGREIDIYFPTLKIGVEANGDYWHSSKIMENPRERHLRKLEDAHSRGVKLVFVWSSDWTDRRVELEDSLRRFVCEGDMPDSALTILEKG